MEAGQPAKHIQTCSDSNRVTERDGTDYRINSSLTNEICETILRNEETDEFKPGLSGRLSGSTGG